MSNKDGCKITMMSIFGEHIIFKSQAKNVASREPFGMYIFKIIYIYV